MNNIAAHLLTNLTRSGSLAPNDPISSVRFEGSLNVDLNDVTMNLVPFPKMHFILASLRSRPLYNGLTVSPLYLSKESDSKPGRWDLGACLTLRIDAMFSDVFSRDHQLVKLNPREHLCS